MKYHIRTIRRDEPIMTAPTNEWSNTQRVATLAILAASCRFPMVRRVARSSWKSAQLPHALRIMSRYYEKILDLIQNWLSNMILTLRWEGVSSPTYKSGSGSFNHRSARNPPHCMTNKKKKLDIHRYLPEFHTSTIWRCASHKHPPYHTVALCQLTRTVGGLIWCLM